MKTRITVGWAYTVEVDVDPARVNDEAYRNEIRGEALEQASGNMSLKDGMITDCEDFPDLAE